MVFTEGTRLKVCDLGSFSFLFMLLMISLEVMLVDLKYNNNFVAWVRVSFVFYFLFIQYETTFK